MNTLTGIFRDKNVRNKVLLTILVLVLIRIGCHIPLPGIDRSVLEGIFDGMRGGALDFLNTFTGSSFERMSVFALNITVYITASIIMQLMTLVFPRLDEMQKDGETGRKKYEKITRWLTAGLAFAESIAMCIGFGRQGLYGDAEGASYWLLIAASVALLTAGAVGIMWMGEWITKKGIGNGVSLILAVNIISTMPADYRLLAERFVFGADNIGFAVLGGVLIVGLTLAVIAFIVYLNGGERRIPVQYSRKAPNGRMTGASSVLPVKISLAGVAPVIFAVSLMQFPVLIAGFIRPGTTPEWTKFLSSGHWFDPQHPLYTVGVLLYIFLIIAFSYFYAQIIFPPAKTAKTLKEQGGTVSGIRPGHPTEECLKGILKYTVFIGAAGICIAALVPMAVSGIFHTTLSFAGTSLIIVVSVITETSQKLKSMLMHRNYEGFLAASPAMRKVL